MGGTDSGSQLNKSQNQYYKTLFAVIDKDGDGKISVNDLKETFSSHQIAIDDKDIANTMLVEGELDYSGFVKLVGGIFSGFSEEGELNDAFATFTNGDSDVVDSNLLKKSVLAVIENEDDKTKVGKVIEGFTKENKISGTKKFQTDDFVDRVKQ